MLEALDLTARRGALTLFAGVNFQLPPGRAMALTGPNGSGKTTLLRILAGLTAPWAGAVRWRDEILSPTSSRIRADAVLCGHLPALKDELSATENLTVQCALAGHAVAPAEVREALGAVGLDRSRALPAGVLSQGQRRRIALARLKLLQRPLWLLDEPSTALDAAGLALLSRLLRDHIDSGGTVVAATHHPLDLPAERITTQALA